MKLKKGVNLFEEIIGKGSPVKRHKYYIFSIRIHLSKGDVVKIPNKCLGHSIDGNMKVNENGFFEYRARFDRENFVSGIFYTIDEMNAQQGRKRRACKLRTLCLKRQ